MNGTQRITASQESRLEMKNTRIQFEKDNHVEVMEDFPTIMQYPNQTMEDMLKSVNDCSSEKNISKSGGHVQAATIGKDSQTLKMALPTTTGLFK